MAIYASMNIKIKATQPELEKAINYFKTIDCAIGEANERLFVTIEKNYDLDCDEKMREMMTYWKSVFNWNSLNIVGIWTSEEMETYKDFFYKYKNDEIYYQTSDIYGLKEDPKKMTYEEFCATYQMEDEISEEEFNQLMAWEDEELVSASGEYYGD